jgi:hypothetical protein
VTNHAVVAMIGEEVKQTRCTTCDAEHEYKHAKIPRQRRKSETPAALYSQVAAGKPKRIPHESESVERSAPDAAEPHQETEEIVASAIPESHEAATLAAGASPDDEDEGDVVRGADHEDGPVHRPLIRATLPRPEGQPPPQRQNPDFTIRQPGGRPNRFRQRHQRGAQQFFGNRQNGNVGGSMRRPPHGSMTPRAARRQGSGRKRSK